MEQPNNWLNECARNVYSQHGEDGIIEKALDTIGDTDGWCIDVGAWDGVYLSNTCNLIRARNYHAVLFDANKDRVSQSKANYADCPNVESVHAFVGFDEDTSLDALLDRLNLAIPTNFDVLSVDIDGNDYHVWDHCTRYRPKIVVIEFNPTIPNSVEFVQPPDKGISQGCSIRSLCQLANQKKYELAAATHGNAIFVDSAWFHSFGIEDNSVEKIRKDDSAVTYLFHGYDGNVYLAGNRMILWHQLPFTESRVQQMPRFLRRRITKYGPCRKLALHLYRLLRYRRIL